VCVCVCVRVCVCKGRGDPLLRSCTVYNISDCFSIPSRYVLHESSRNFDICIYLDTIDVLDESKPCVTLYKHRRDLTMGSIVIGIRTGTRVVTTCG
jgi:hypothetical protein